MFISFKGVYFRKIVPNFRYLTFINVFIYLIADCFPYFCIAILQNNLKHYIMIIKIRVLKLRQEKVDTLL